jgi:hypothetical protein
MDKLLQFFAYEHLQFHQAHRDPARELRAIPGVRNVTVGVVDTNPMRDGAIDHAACMLREAGLT